MEMKEHELKCWHGFYDEIVRGRKSFEIRKDDRGFNEGDILKLREWHPIGQVYSGQEAKARIDYIVKSGFGLRDGYACMAITLLRGSEKRTQCPCCGQIIPKGGNQ